MGDGLQARTLRSNNSLALIVLIVISLHFNHRLLDFFAFDHLPFCGRTVIFTRIVSCLYRSAWFRIWCERCPEDLAGPEKALVSNRKLKTNIELKKLWVPLASTPIELRLSGIYLFRLTVLRGIFFFFFLNSQKSYLPTAKQTFHFFKFNDRGKNEPRNDFRIKLALFISSPMSFMLFGVSRTPYLHFPGCALLFLLSNRT